MIQDLLNVDSLLRLPWHNDFAGRPPSPIGLIYLLTCVK